MRVAPEERPCCCLNLKSLFNCSSPKNNSVKHVSCPLVVRVKSDVAAAPQNLLSCVQIEAKIISDVAQLLSRSAERHRWPKRRKFAVVEEDPLHQ